MDKSSEPDYDLAIELGDILLKVAGSSLVAGSLFVALRTVFIINFKIQTF